MDGLDTYKGDIWSFTTSDFMVVDDFEDYDIGNNEIWWSWKDGLGYAAHDNEPAYPGNGTGSAVGDETTMSYCEETIVHGGGKSMPYFYNTSFKFSKAELTLSPPQDWIKEGFGELSLWFRGDKSNAPAPMSVILNGNAAVYHDNPNAVQIDTWTEWIIGLQEFTDVDLTNVNSIAICFGIENDPQPGGSGKMLFDDIRLYQSR